jgi:hypothetical protein
MVKAAFPSEQIDQYIDSPVLGCACWFVNGAMEDRLLRRGRCHRLVDYFE